MKTNKIVYWASTGIFALLMAFSGVNSFSNPEVIEGFRHLGFPDYFRMELGTAKIIGAIVLLVPQFGRRLKEWAYAGFGITLLSASIAHTVSGDPISKTIAPLVIFGILALSYTYSLKRQA
ncbi:MAG: DoxX family protein [Leptospira sp.]|nr:DoxX family protein [Leptospira sp.]